MLFISCSILLLLLVSANARITPRDTFDSYVRSQGFPSESTHYATTEDGYILNLWRIPNPGKPVIFLQHGIMASGFCYVVNEKSRAIAFQLFEAGYDVWLGNNRGNRWSTNHTTLKTHSKEFWNFTFEEMGTYDLPAMISYVKEFTSKDKLVLVAWSQGTTQTFIGSSGYVASSKFMHDSVSLFEALSPVTFMEGGSGKGLLRDLAKLGLGKPVAELWPYSFLQDNKAEDEVVKVLCKLTLGAVCKITVDLICGTSNLDSKNAIADFTTHFPSGTSTKDIWQYEQYIDAKSEFFGRFDYGKSGNQAEYGQNTPPSFDVSTISIPTAFFLGAKDLLVESKDFQTLRNLYSNSSVVFEKNYADFSHVTWVVGTEQAASIWMDDFKSVIEQHAV